MHEGNEAARLSKSKTRSVAAIGDSHVIPGECAGARPGIQCLRERTTIGSRFHGNDERGMR
jgi:hypothetical protein